MRLLLRLSLPRKRQKLRRMQMSWKLKKPMRPQKSRPRRMQRRLMTRQPMSRLRQTKRLQKTRRKKLQWETQ